MKDHPIATNYSNVTFHPRTEIGKYTVGWLIRHIKDKDPVEQIGVMDEHGLIFSMDRRPRYEAEDEGACIYRIVFPNGDVEWTKNPPTHDSIRVTKFIKEQK